MSLTSSLFRKRLERGTAAVLVMALALAATPALGWVDLGSEANGPYNPSGALVADGSYVMNVGELQINITNWGLIGSHYSNATSYSDAPSAQWPAGSGNEYLWAAGLWVGGLRDGQRTVSTGQPLTAEAAEDDLTERLAAALDGRYRIVDRLGEGGMAVVYLAEDLKHHRQVAVKVLRAELAAVIGGEHDLAPAGGRQPVDGGDDRLGAGAHRLHRVAGHLGELEEPLGVAREQRLDDLEDVAAGAEPLPLAGQDHDPGRLVVGEGVHGPP